MPAIAGGTVCRMHGGAAPQVLASARERFLQRQPQAFVVLDTLLAREEFPTVQMQAVREVFDRTEGKAAQPVAVTGGDGGPLIIEVRRPW